MSQIDTNWALLTQLDAGTLRVEREPFDLGALVEAVVEQTEPRAHAKFLSFMAFVAPEIPARVLGSPAYLQRVLLILIHNAIRLTEKGEVDLRVTLEDRTADRVTVRFEVRDTGIGLPDDVVEDTRAPAADPPPPDAPRARIAFALARGLARTMGGTLDVVASGSQGTVVSFTAALAPAAAPVPTASPPGAAVPPGQALHPPLKVLVVDDNQTHREILHRYLHFWGIDNTGAATGEEALAELRAAAAAGDPYAVAILDLAMPGMDGFALAHAIRREARLADTRLILLTAYDERGQGELALREGFSAYLTKPVKHGNLFTTIQAVVLGAREPAPAGA